MAGSFVLDARILIPLVRAEQPLVDRLDQAGDIFVPAVAIGELFYGASKSSRHEETTKVETLWRG